MTMMINRDSTYNLSSMALTRSKAAAQQATPLQQATETEEDLVSINWIFFDKSDPDECEPFPIDVTVPRSLFNSASKNMPEAIY